VAAAAADPAALAGRARRATRARRARAARAARAGAAVVGRGREAVGRQRRLAHADLAVAAGVEAGCDLRAGRALRGIVEGRRRAGGCEVDGVRGARHQAAAEAVAAVRRDPAADVDAHLRLRGRAVAEARVVGTGLGRVGAGAERVALEVPLAAVVAHARVAVEEAVLLAGVHVVAGDAGGEGRLVVVEGPHALGVGRVDGPVAVVVLAVVARGAVGVAAAAGRAARAGPARPRRSDRAGAAARPGRGRAAPAAGADAAA